jgi:hypothetical protein
MIRGAIRTLCGHTHTMVEPPLTVRPKPRPGPVPAASRGCARVSGMVRYTATPTIAAANAYGKLIPGIRRGRCARATPAGEHHVASGFAYAAQPN